MNRKNFTLVCMFLAVLSLPTLAGLQDVEAPANDGISMLPTLLGNADEQKEHEYLYFEYPEKGGQLAIRMGKWKGVKTNIKEHPEAKWEVYDLEEDLAETKNVASQHPELLEQFDKIVKKEHWQATIKKWEFIDL